MSSNGKTNLPAIPPDFDPALSEHLQELVTVAPEIGAREAWIVRSAQALGLSFALPGRAAPVYLNLADAGGRVLLHFPASDGQGPGVEHRPAGPAPNSNSAN